MKRLPIVFLKAVVILIALMALAFLIFFPPQEGRARDLDLLSIYLDPVILYAYAASIVFFTALYKAFELLGLIGQNKIFTPEAVKALRGIRNCALILGGSIILLALFIRLTLADDEDSAGFTTMSIVLTFATLVVATAAAIFGRVLQGAIDIKSENELTI